MRKLSWHILYDLDGKACRLYHWANSLKNKVLIALGFWLFVSLILENVPTTQTEPSHISLKGY